MTDAGRALPLPDPRAVTAPVTVIAVADDDVVPPAAVWRLMQMFPEAVKCQRVLRPEGRPIGHIRAFAAEHQSLWPQILD
jgi:predicted alpha/beta hydrolase